jgi:hypothetical protein
MTYCLLINSFLIFCLFNLVLLHANEAEYINECIPSFLANLMTMRVLEILSKFVSQLIICPHATSPTIMKLDKRDIRVAKESIQSADYIEFLGQII